jgi:hypothetical protein
MALPYVTCGDTLSHWHTGTQKDPKNAKIIKFLNEQIFLKIKFSCHIKVRIAGRLT